MHLSVARLGGVALVALTLWGCGPGQPGRDAFCRAKCDPDDVEDFRNCLATCNPPPDKVDPGEGAGGDAGSDPGLSSESDEGE